MSVTTSRDFFQIGGTLDEDSPSYIERPADGELLEAVARGDLCLVLAPRQTGKSSLTVHARARLKASGIAAGIVDLQHLGSTWDAAAWFGDVAFQIQRSLGLATDALQWWELHSQKIPTTRFMVFLEDVVLAETEGRVVLFFDEIDSALRRPFSDDFFTTIRAVYNARAANPTLRRLSFVLLGVATASDFIKDRSRTPFNIGHEIELKDFDEDALYAFNEVLGSGCEHLVDRIFHWTAGQPLMVQKLAEAVYRTLPPERSPERVDRIVQETFLDIQVEKDTHFKFIRDYLLEGNPKLHQTLKTYRSVLMGDDVLYDDRSATHARLRLAGVVTRDGKRLVPRNRIYEKVFDAAWVSDNMPRNTAKIIAVTSSAALVAVLLWFFIIKHLLFPEFTYYQQQPWWPDGDIHYTEERTFRFRPSLPNIDISKVTVDGQTVPLAADHTANSYARPGSLTIEIPNLPLGASSHLVRIFGRPWQENFETRLLVVSFPRSKWKVLQEIEMVAVPAGCFEMGCVGDSSDCTDYINTDCCNDEKPVHRVCLEAFEMGVFEVTQDQWTAVMGDNYSFHKDGGGRLPVEQVRWDEAREFIRRLNALTGKQYRLPTEAEWEYAARSGGREETYAGGENLNELGWYDENSKRKTHPVGQKKPNGLGLYDMTGNVWEWVEDDWHASYGGAPTDGSAWVNESRAVYRVLRGGGWHDDGHYCRLATRGSRAHDETNYDVGFRLARSVTFDP